MDREDRFTLVKDDLTTDAYFIDTFKVAFAQSKNPWVKYNVFTRSSQPFVFAGLGLIKPILKNQGAVISYALEEGTIVEGEAITLFTYEGLFQDVIDLETHILGILSECITAATEMWKIVSVANKPDGTPIPITYFGARHRAPGIGDLCWSYGSIVGGASGIAVPRTSRLLGLPPAIGTVPHAGVLALSESTLDVATQFTSVLPGRPNKPMIDTFGKEMDDAIELVKHFREGLHGVRIDTCGEGICQGCKGSWPYSKSERDDIDNRIIDLCMINCIPECNSNKWIYGQGVSVEAIYRLRKTLDNNNGKHVQIIATSGFNPKKTKMFTILEAPVDAYGCGMMHPEVNFGATSDIVEVEYKQRHKARRYESSYVDGKFVPKTMKKEPMVLKFRPMEVKLEGIVGS